MESNQQITQQWIIILMSQLPIITTVVSLILEAFLITIYFSTKELAVCNFHNHIELVEVLRFLQLSVRKPRRCLNMLLEIFMSMSLISSNMNDIHPTPKVRLSLVQGR